MRAEEFILALSERAGSEEELRRLQKGVPLGKDEQGNIVFSQTREKPLAIRHTCVTGADRTAFIKRLVVALSCLYERSEINFPRASNTANCYVSTVWKSPCRTCGVSPISPK